MAIPDFQTVMLPLLRFFVDKKERKFSDAVAFLLMRLRASWEI